MPAPNTRILSRRLRELRRQLQLSQARMAPYLGVTQSALSRLEHGHLELSIAQLIKLKDNLGLDIGAFLDPSQPKNGRASPTWLPRPTARRAARKRGR